MGVPVSPQAAPPVEQPSVSTRPSRSGRILTALVLFLLFTGITRVMKASPVHGAAVRLGLSESLIVAIGITLLVCAFPHVIRRSSILGAILPTRHLGAAVSGQTLVPGLFGALVWLGLPKPPCMRRFPCAVDLIPFQALGKKEA